MSDRKDKIKRSFLKACEQNDEALRRLANTNISPYTQDLLKRSDEAIRKLKESISRSE